MVRDRWLKELESSIDTGLTVLNILESIDNRTPSTPQIECYKALRKAKEWAEEIE